MNASRLGVALLATATLVTGSLATASDAPVALQHDVVSRRPHDPSAFTQGLVLDGDGRLFESTGLLGESSLREVDSASGEVMRIRELPESHFGEGLALVDDRLLQLTWRDGVATAWDVATFEPVATYAYDSLRSLL